MILLIYLMLILLLMFLYNKYKKSIKYYCVLFFTKYYDFFLKHKRLKIVKNIFITFSIYVCFNGILFLIIFALWLLKLYFFRMNFNKRNTTIEIIGSPGSGKTTLVAFLSKHFIAQGYKVFTDVDILGTYPFEWINHYGLYNMENSIIIQDEAGTVEGLQNRDYKSNFKGDEGQSRLNMLKRHRHYKQDLFFLSQGEDFEKRVKDLCTEYWVLKHTNINWLLIIDIYRSEIEVDEMTQDFRLAKKKIKRRFLFSPVVWLSFDTFECVKLPDLNNNPRGIK